MDFNFPLILVIAVFLTGVLAACDYFLLAPRRRLAVEQYKASTSDVDDDVVLKITKEPAVFETAKSIFPILLIVLVVRSFLFEPFQIPSGSMKPTLAIGDFILVNKYAYGVRLPVIGTKVINVGDPQRGDVMVFKEPANPSINFIKRVVGLPGDTIKYKDKQLFVNGELVEEHFIAQLHEQNIPYKLLEENLGGVKHQIRENAFVQYQLNRLDGEWTVPEGHYFMMGDNRDNSNDSRSWGFVPDANVVGKAIYIWMHWPSWGQLPSFKNNGAIQ
ncbi:signal peptidase I [Zooshikella sp. RANM57]|uniref:signal peptidase I n=1 Tax=Zooshikella sp. RANM57 TaxID=3425863 RepID=UPI003D6F607A